MSEDQEMLENVSNVEPSVDNSESKVENESDPILPFDNFKNPEQNKTNKKIKKPKKNWKNRYGKQKNKGTVQPKDTPEKKSARRIDHIYFKSKASRNRIQALSTLSKFFLPYKRPRKDAFIPPTKFLLGGNISDPLNLNSLQDEDVNRAMNAITPKSSPLPTPPRHKAKFDVIIPPDIRDPLNLLNPLDNDEYEKRLEKVKSRKGRKRTKSKRHSSEYANPQVDNSINSSPVVIKSEDVEISIESKAIESPSPDAPVGIKPKELKLDLSLIKAQKRTSSESESVSQKGKDNKKIRRMDSLDKIVSPVVPQPGAWMRVHTRTGVHTNRGGSSNHHGKIRQPRKSINQDEMEPQENLKTMPKFKPQNSLYQYGNYDRYYGYRNLNATMDVRLKVFEMHKHLFLNKDVLDIGCNVGHISIAVARELGAKSVKGIDIDDKLIGRARRNLIYFIEVPILDKQEVKNEAMDCATDNVTDIYSKEAQGNVKEETINVHKLSPMKSENIQNVPVGSHHIEAYHHLSNRQTRKYRKNRRFHQKHGQENSKNYFPISCPILYGPMQLPGFPSVSENKGFPHNIKFLQANYILKDENLINAEVPQFDLILCLSLTKWLHLNWGDAGIKMAFKRMFAQLRPGGKLILEAQNWASYKKKNKLTETTYNNYKSIEFLPNKFREYLLSPEVGFSKCCVLGVPQHLSKGFRRPIQLYIKGDFTPSKVQWSDNYAPSSHHRPESGPDRQSKIVYANVVSPSYHPSSSRWSNNNTPLYGKTTPFSLNLDNAAEESPFYNPRSDKYLPSYSTAGQVKNVYASLTSPQSDFGSTPTHLTETTASTKTRVYTTMASPASPFVEPSPGNSATPGHAFTPSHSANFDAQNSRRKVYASVQSPQQEGNCTPHHPAYSPSVAGVSSARCKHPGAQSPLHTGSSFHQFLDSKETDIENTNSSESIQIKDITTKISSERHTPTSSPSCSDQPNVADNTANHFNPSCSIDDE